MSKNKRFWMGLLIVGALYGNESSAHGQHHFSHGFHRHPGISLQFGFPLFSYPYYSYPYYRYRYYDYPYYYPPVVAVPSTPPVYIEQPRSEVQEYPAGYWYYCDSPEGYYPYIKECPGGWRRVDPVP